MNFASISPIMKANDQQDLSNLRQQQLFAEESKESKVTENDKNENYNVKE